MHNIFQPLSSVALLQQRRQHYLKEKQLKWELADWDLATRKQKAAWLLPVYYQKEKQTNKQKPTFVPLNVQVRAQVSAGSREGRGAKEDVVNFKINVSHSRGYMKLSDWRFCSIRMVLEENILGKLGKFRIANGDSARVTNTNFLLTFSRYNQEKRLWELINWSPKGKYFDLLSNSLN